MSGYNPEIPEILTHERMYQLQIGDKLFIISGASLASDGPSYFTNYFLENKGSEKVFIDRSPEVFQYIYSHLQGYHIEIPNGEIFTKLFSDSIYFNLPRLKNLLLNDDYYYIEVMGQNLKIPRKFLNVPGNSPNYFTITFNALYRDIRDLMISKKLIRPPPQASPKLHRDPDLLRDLIKLLQGIEFPMSPEHKRSLIKEAKYYRFNSIVAELSVNKLIHDVEDNNEYLVMNMKDIDPVCFIVADDERTEYRDFKSTKRIKLESEMFEEVGYQDIRRAQYKQSFTEEQYFGNKNVILEIESPCTARINHSNVPLTENLIYSLEILDNEFCVKFFEIVDHIESMTTFKLDKTKSNFFQTSYNDEVEIDGFLQSEDTTISYSTDSSGFLRFDSIDFKYNGSSTSKHKLTLSDLPSTLLFKKSYWKFEITFFAKSEIFIIELIPVKIDAVGYNRGAMFGALLE